VTGRQVAQQQQATTTMKLDVECQGVPEAVVSAKKNRAVASVAAVAPELRVCHKGMADGAPL